ncbi:MAG: 3-keto-5-aminohexanoate cleavage protein [Gammaproteobacteria bacterium]|nr:3-keto-5-aminohexanoate cleavage protein [Gammaproteobacteria bacterium]MDH3505635.1 3-keto-5-aminohexanoate cleavage protein [Gammaproteobacteria bacterium]
MPRPVIFAVAITGSIPRKAHNPAVPVTPEEQIESTHAAYEAGASLAHIHVRNPDESSSSDPELFARVQEGLRKHCPDMIQQFSTGGRGRDPAERGSSLSLKPDMASLATGSVNFKTIIYENEPQLIDALAEAMLEYEIKPEIEIFDLAMLYNAADLVERGLLKAPAHVQFVLGIPNALPPRRKMLEFLLSELEEVLPGATWTAAGIARHQIEMARWSLELGGHVRTGLEDNIKLDRETLAPSNAALVEQCVALCDEYDTRPATPTEAREMLGLRPAT